MSDRVDWDDLEHSEQVALSFRGPAELSRLHNPHRKIPKHVKYMSREVADTVRDGIRTGRGQIVIVEMPPGHIKSDTISVHSPLWFLDNWPDKNVAVCSYGHSKASEWGELVRDEAKEHAETLTFRLKADSRAKHKWKTDQGGGMMCAGVSGALTGFRAHFLVVDDPIKDDMEAESPVYREKVWRWWQKVVLTRLWPSATIFIVMTRWHHDDLAGRVKAVQKAADEQGLAHTPVRVISFPCVAAGDDVLGRKKGDYLWPEGGYDAEWGARKKTDVGSRTWEALYQQNPTAEEGSMFRRKDFRYFEMEPDNYVLHGDNEPQPIPKNHCAIIQTSDTAMKDGEENDYTVITTVAITPFHQMLVLDIRRDHLAIPDQWPYVRDCIIQYARGSDYRWTGCEDAGSGIGLLELARRAGMPMRALKPDMNKTRRATPASIHYQNHLVYHLQHAPWLAALESELMEFPHGAHDDQVDTIAYAVREATLMPDPRIPDRSPAGTGKPDIRPHDRFREGVGVVSPTIGGTDDLDEDDIAAGF